MKEVFENIKEKIKNQPIEQFVDTNGNWDLVQTVLDCCCEAVDRVKEEYNNGWIPCSERLPDAEADVLLSLRSLDIYVGFMANTEGMFYVEGEGYVEYENVLAWQPLPTPYQPKGE